jgi:DNA-damage-inducible protein D
MNDFVALRQGAFDDVRLLSPDGDEYWRARTLQVHLGYETWENFENAIERAMEAARTSGYQVENQFRATTKLVESGSGAKRHVKDYFLSRYACYLIAMNGDPSKREIAAAQSYFAIQTRRQEVADSTTDDEKRLEIRERVRESSTALNSTASRAGVNKFGFFHDAGYKGMYKASQSTVKAMKGIKPNEDFLDCVGPLELAANEFRIRLTEEKLRTGNVRGQQPAEKVHESVGRRVRQTVVDEIGRPPEKLPRAESIKKLESRKRKELKGK